MRIKFLKFWQQTFHGHAKKYHFFLLEIPPEIRMLGAKYSGHSKMKTGRPAKPAQLTEAPKPKAKVCRPARPSRSQPPHPETLLSKRNQV